MLHAESMRTLGANLWTPAAPHVLGLALLRGRVLQPPVDLHRRVQRREGSRPGGPVRLRREGGRRDPGRLQPRNRPNWARGTIGATVFTFKQFSIAYIEFLKRLPPQQRLLALAILWLLAGTQGLPFAEDIEDIIDTIAQGWATTSTAASDAQGAHTRRSGTTGRSS
jgi:hypothetical protein